MLESAAPDSAQLIQHVHIIGHVTRRPEVLAVREVGDDGCAVSDGPLDLAGSGQAMAVGAPHTLLGVNAGLPVLDDARVPSRVPLTALNRREVQCLVVGIPGPGRIHGPGS